MLALVLGQGAMALSHHRDQLFAWIAGAVVLAAITAVPGDVRLRVEIAYAVSSLTVAVTLAAGAVRPRGQVLGPRQAWPMAGWPPPCIREARDDRDGSPR